MICLDSTLCSTVCGRTDNGGDCAERRGELNDDVAARADQRPALAGSEQARLCVMEEKDDGRCEYNNGRR